MDVQLTILPSPQSKLPRSQRRRTDYARARTMEEVTTCHSSLSVKHSPQTNLGSIRWPVGSTNGRPILVRSFCSSGPQLAALSSLFSRVARRSRKELRSRAEARRALHHLSSILRQFRSSLREATALSSLLTRLAVSHRQLTVSLSSTRSEDFDDGDIQRNTQRALQSRAPKNLRD